MVAAQVQLGLGSIGIGKPWGHVPGAVPAERDAIALLEFAFELGIRYFDTAASYGVSEERVGIFLKGVGDRRRELTIATKFGEHWDAARSEPFVDHSFDALARSLDRSLDRLGSVDILQLHKTTPEVLASADLARAWDYAATLGIRRIGPSVSDPESARIALADRRYVCMQLPFNARHPEFGAVMDAAGLRGMWVAVNRPYAMGAMLHEQPIESKADAFRSILARKFEGAILTGTTSRDHLRENWDAFQQALRDCGRGGPGLTDGGVCTIL